MNNIFLIFPHQLFKNINVLKNASSVYLVEEYLFFNQYKFHRQKLVFHRASMKYYESFLRENGINVVYINANQDESDIRIFIKKLKNRSKTIMNFYSLYDNWLEKRIKQTSTECSVKTIEHDSNYFINKISDFNNYFGGKSKYLQRDFYIRQRKKLNILIKPDGKPVGDKWSFDEENRKKYPKDKKPPVIKFPSVNPFYVEAMEYVEKNYPLNYGNISNNFIYPISHKDSDIWLEQFLKQRLFEFGDYEDSIVKDQNILNHSVLSPLLNAGLLTPLQVINKSLEFSNKFSIPLNSLEGFIRQIIGWREFICSVYLRKGSKQRTTNFWKLSNPVPSSFYNGITGIKPVDVTIKKVIETGYCHHIERLMLLGNFMLLCEIHPDYVYQWFMEMFIDAYDWVMVPNVYGMSQFADGGLMATKPYISGSSYVLKMSDYKKEKWCDVWDALFWSFMDKYRDFFLSNPRLGLLIKTYDKMSEEKRNSYKRIKKEFLSSLF